MPLPDIVVYFPVSANMSMNSRAHWAVKARKVKMQRDTVGWMLKGRVPPVPPMVIHLTRIAPRMMDKTNYVTALKAVEDAVAAWIGIDDSKLDFRMHQRKGPTAVQMRIEHG